MSEIQKKEVRERLGQLYDLTLYDPENLTYKLSFLDYAFEYILKTGLPANLDLMSNISDLTSELSNSIAHKDYYQAMFELVIFEQDDMGKIKELSAKLRNESWGKLSKEKQWKMLQLYFLQKKSPEIAEMFLSTLKEISDIPFPTFLDNQILAHLELNNCSQVSSLSKALHTRGFYKTYKIKC